MRTIINIFILFALIQCNSKFSSNHERFPGMVFIKGGRFQMGNDSVFIRKLAIDYKLPYDYLASEEPKHTVVVSSYYIDKYEVTNIEFKRFIDANPEWKKENISPDLHNGNYLKTWSYGNYPAGEDSLPVTNVCWYAAMAYSKWVGKRLPSEAEWEYAAKAGKDQFLLYPWGNAEPDTSKANYRLSGYQHAVKVGKYPPNEIGLYDLAGNVWEYCLDRWDDHFYSSSPVNNPISGKDSLDNFLLVKTRRVIRGGSWGAGKVNLMIDFRDSHPTIGAGDHVGFRCVKDIK